MEKVTTRPDGTVRVQLTGFDESKTKQSMKDECDINVIVKRYEKTGVLTHLVEGEPQYLDVSEITDYRGALEQVEKANEAFAQLPASVRARFNNQPAEFLDAMTAERTPEHVAELKALGLWAEGKAEEPPVKASPEAVKP